MQVAKGFSKILNHIIMYSGYPNRKILILAAVIGLLLAMGFAAVKWLFAPTRYVEGVVDMKPETRTSLSLNGFQQISGTPYAVADLVSAQAYERSMYSKESTSIRNLIFLNQDNLAGHRLWERDDRLILSREAFTQNPAAHDTEKPPVTHWGLDVVPKDTNQDGLLTHEDLHDWVVADADGRNAKSVLTGVDYISYVHQRSPDQLVLVFQKDKARIACQISLSQRKVLATKPLISLP